MKMDDAAIKDIDVVSTGSLGLDLALGVGGLPRGRVVEIYGPESSGKTTLTLQVIAEMQKLGGTAAFIDAENALDISYAAKLGVKTEDLLISQPDTGEQALEIADMLVARFRAVDAAIDPGDQQIVIGHGFDDRKAAGVLDFVHRARRCETALAVFHGKSNIGAGLVALAAGDRPNGEDFTIAVKGHFRPIFFALDGFDVAIDPFRRAPAFASIVG
jgi:hypothetical protein